MEKTNPLSAEKQALLALRLRGASKKPADARHLFRRANDDPAPLSFAQFYIWASDQVAPGNPSHNLPVGFRIRGQLDVGLLEYSFNAIVQRHEALRTTFAVKDGEPIQVIHPECRIKIAVIELAHLPVDEGEIKLQKLASKESVELFDLSRLPLIRVSLFKLGDTDHVLVINLHHIIADGLSFGLLLHELDALYRAFKSGSPPNLPELPVQYADFAFWLRREFLKNSYPDQAEYWRAQMNGRLCPLALPFDRARPTVRSFSGANVFFTIHTSLVEKLNSLNKESGGTFFSIALALFQVILHRYSGSEDMLILTPVSIRIQDEIRPLIGNFLNLVPLRCDVSGNPTFIELLRRSRETTLNGLSNKDLPFDKIVDGMKIERDSGRDPIFQFLLQVLPAGGAKFADLEIGSFQIDLAFSQFDLSLHLYERAEGYLGRFEYSTDVFYADTVERLSLNFMQLLEAVVADPNQTIAALPLLSTMERHHLLEWAGQGNDVSDPAFVQELIEAQARQAPERTAVRVGATVLYYGELKTRANRLAQTLRALGVGRGQRVGLCVERGADMVAAVLGILKSGAACVPLDPLFPAIRLRFMAEDAQIALLVSTRALAELFGLPRERQLLLDADAKSIAAAPDTRLPVDAHTARPEDPAYVIYTSGSIGKPKGVVIPHRAVVNSLTGTLNEPGLSAEDVLVDAAPLSFDIAALGLQLPLAVGATLVIATRDEAMDGHALRGLLEQHRATVMQATPVTWRLLLEAGWAGGSRFKALVGGEALPRDLAEQLLARGIEVWTMYGSTETLWSTRARITEVSNRVTIGKPIANTTAYILDAQQNLCPIGVSGELCIGGAQVTLGYWNRPELTAEHFIPDPFSATPGATLYRTGDRARWRNDGTLEHLGRLDDQAKLLGFRIELGEIESLLNQHPAVRESVVVVREDNGTDKRLVGYWVAREKQAVTGSELRAYLKGKLPDYMIPPAVVLLDSVPLTPNGKLDRNALPAPTIECFEGPGDYIAPRNPTEETLLRIWSEILKVENIGVRDDFFRLGGQSLLAVSLFATIEREFGKKLPLATLFRAPTVEQLAAALNNGSDHFSTDWASLVPIQTKGSKRPLFLVHGAGGNVLLYRFLAEYLAPDYPLYGLQSRGLDGNSAPLATIEEMAIEYLREIRTIQRKGPYYLGGYCLGGTVAYEMAQILHREGEEVALVAMLDTYNFSRALKASFAGFLFQKLRFHLGNLAPMRPREMVNYVVEKVRVARDGELAHLKSFMPGSTKVEGVSPAVSGIEASVQAVNDYAADHYLAKPYPGRLTLFKPQINYKFYPDPKMGWGDLALGGLDIVELSMYPHAMLVEPFVGLLAAELKRRMELSQGGLA